MEVINELVKREEIDPIQLAMRNCDVDSENLANKIEVASIHCLICNVSITSQTNMHNVFGQLTSGAHASRISVFEKVGQVLKRTLGSIHLHSEIICQQCLSILIEHEEVKQKLQQLCSVILSKFDETSNLHPSNTVELCHKNESILETASRRGLTPNRLIITEEGKVVDKNGKEQEHPLNVIPVNKSKIKKVKNKAIKKSKTSSGNDNQLRQYVCPVCGKGFRAFSHRVEHMLIHLGEKPWDCTKCKKTFRTKSALRVHTTKHSGQRPFTCQHCGKSFVDRYYFEEHCRIHSGERPYVCSFCQRPFIRKKDLAIHLRSHTGDKPYHCTFCPKTFAVNSRLDRHLRIHSGDKPHSCEYCGKRFARRDDYRVHARQHTGEKPFECAFCKKTFTNQSNCMAHVRTHTGNTKNHPCSLCSEKFDRRCKLDKHLSDIHLDQQGVPSTNIQTLESIVQVDSIQSMTGSVIHALKPDMQGNQVEPLLLNSLPEGQTESLPEASLSQSLVHSESLQSLTVADLQALQTLPLGPIAQLAWSDGTTAGTTTTYVNITPGTYVNII